MWHDYNRFDDGRIKYLRPFHAGTKFGSFTEELAIQINSLTANARSCQTQLLTRQPITTDLALLMCSLPNFTVDGDLQIRAMLARTREIGANRRSSGMPIDISLAVGNTVINRSFRHHQSFRHLLITSLKLFGFHQFKLHCVATDHSYP